ncbi:MAG: hypothetical protein KKH22_04430 [Proteobacteria bacterium]|nr:hypothetical protein [Pseudomonadota bacterium]
MQKHNYLIITILFLFISSSAFAGSVLDDDKKEAIVFLKEQKRITAEVDEVGLLMLWQQMSGIKSLVFLKSKGALSAEMDKELAIRVALLPKNLNKVIDHPDPLVQSLARLVRLNEKFAEKSMSRRIDYYDYSDVANYTIEHGRVLAEMVEAKYGKGKKIIQPLPTW